MTAKGGGTLGGRRVRIAVAGDRAVVRLLRAGGVSVLTAMPVLLSPASDRPSRDRLPFVGIQARGLVRHATGAVITGSWATTTRREDTSSASADQPVVFGVGSDPQP